MVAVGWRWRRRRRARGERKTRDDKEYGQGKEVEVIEKQMNERLPVQIEK